MLSSFFKRNFLVNSLTVGQLFTNCYIITYNDNHYLVVDPGSEPDFILDALKEKDAKNDFVDIYLTHGHADHIGALPEIMEKYPNAKIYASKKDMQLYTNSNLNLSSALGSPLTLNDYLDKFVYVKDGDVLPLSKKSKDPDVFTVIDTPGHTPGSTTLQVKNAHNTSLFTGDTLFSESIGNTELPLGDFNVLLKSIMEKLTPLRTGKVYPGHGGETSIEHEIRYNPFIFAAKRHINRK